MNEKWVIKSLLRVLPDTVLRVALEYIFCYCEEHGGDYVTNKNRSVKRLTDKIMWASQQLVSLP
ncbi:hypothetical protein, partial [Bacteroides acidifaciens]|uniref:hypothetical protein n=1 Tax=Bacteroides acidifaciens TaxID=85831 RepID=UPI00272D76F6